MEDGKNFVDSSEYLNFNYLTIYSFQVFEQFDAKSKSLSSLGIRNVPQILKNHTINPTKIEPAHLEVIDNLNPALKFESSWCPDIGRLRRFNPNSVRKYIFRTTTSKTE